MVVEQTSRGERARHSPSEDNIIFLERPSTIRSANLIGATTVFSKPDPEKISMCISIAGWLDYSRMALFTTPCSLSPDVPRSVAGVLADGCIAPGCGAKGKRFALLATHSYSPSQLVILRSATKIGSGGRDPQNAQLTSQIIAKHTGQSYRRWNNVKRQIMSAMQAGIWFNGQVVAWWHSLETWSMIAKMRESRKVLFILCVEERQGEHYGGNLRAGCSQIDDCKSAFICDECVPYYQIVTALGFRAPVVISVG